MIRILRRFVFTILVAQWIYAEAVLIAPGSQPMLDTITQFLRPPTHDKWVETYNSFQKKRAEFEATVKSASTKDISQQLVDSVQSFSTEGLRTME